eukprot:jgi/Bigna1/83195/fgenesh1_pg.103_\
MALTRLLPLGLLSTLCILQVLGNDGESQEEPALTEGFGIIMTPASCKMRNMFGAVLKFIEKDAPHYPELKVTEINHTQSPMLKIYDSKERRDKSILKTDEITGTQRSQY